MKDLTGYVAVVETGGNQAYIFESNRLRDAVGASYLLASLEHKAIEALDGCGRVLLTTSGKAEALFASRDLAQAWIRDLTLWSAQNAPGMDLVGAIEQLGDRGIETAIGRAYAKLGSMRGRQALARRTLPWSRPCSYTGLPASAERNPTHPEHERGRRASVEVCSKRYQHVFKATRKRVAQRMKAAGWHDALIQNIDQAYSRMAPDQGEPATDRETWRAVIHADANRMGRVFLNFPAIAQQMGVDWLTAREEFSRAIDNASWRALGDALQEFRGLVHPGVPFQVYPLIVGGDDLTIVCDGRFSLSIAHRYLEAFLERTASEPKISSVMKAAAKYFGDDTTTETGGIHACAGVAIVKHHFPFFTAVGLAEELCRSAKDRVRERPGSAMDWHAVYDASPPSLPQIREKLQHEMNGIRYLLTCRPYRLDQLPPFLDAAKAVFAMNQDGRRKLPNGALNRLRSALFQGPDETKRYIAVLEKRAETWKAQDELVSLLGAGGNAEQGPWTRCQAGQAESSAPSRPEDQKEQKPCYRSAVVDVIDSMAFLEGWKR